MSRSTGPARDYLAAVRFEVLGHLAVRRADGTDVPVPGPSRRQLLAALLCRPGGIVSSATLVEDLWGSAPPRSAVNSLRSHVVRLRAALAQGGGDGVLITVGEGYRLDVGQEQIDAGRFELLVQSAGRTTDVAAALERYDEALGLWRDEPYVEFGDAPFAVLERIRLSELRALAQERRTDLALATGASGELVSDLEHQVHAEPYRERAWEQLALALYRSGRQADALSACRRARRVLLDDLGVDPGPGLQSLEEQLLRQDPQLLTAVAGPVATLVEANRCPYLGLAGYAERDAALFVGRERLTSTLAGRLCDQPVVVVTGASGVGKSSLIRAGLVPALRSGALPGSSAWRIDVAKPTSTLLGEHQRRPDLLVLDQAEELFTGMDPAARQDLLHRLRRYVEDEQGRLVLVLRSDFYPRLADVSSLAPHAEHSAVLVGPMRADELRRALVEPATRVGLRIEDELLETIMDDVAGQPEPLPLLSEAMVRTWERRDGDVLTLQAYEQAGELAGALEAAAEDCYGALDSSRQAAARRLLVRMAARTDTGWVRRPVTHDEASQQAPEDLLAALANARLVTITRDRVEISHEALLTRWPRLAGWLAERASAAALLAHLEAAERAWRLAGRPVGDLYRGGRLQEALERRAARPEDFSPGESEFLDASERFATLELTLAREQARREATGRRRLWWVALALAAMVVLAAIGGLIALKERGTADAQARNARHEASAADASKLAAEALNAPDLRTSLLLAAAGYRLQDSADTRSGLLSAIERFGTPQFRIPTDNRLQWVGASPDGGQVWGMDNMRIVTRFDAHRRRRLAQFALGADHVVAQSPDSHLLIAVGGAFFQDQAHATRAIALDAATGQRRAVLPVTAVQGCTACRSAAFTVDGRWLAIIEATRAAPDTPIARVALLDTNRLDAPPRVLTFAAPVVGVAAANNRIAVWTAAGQLALVDPVTGRTVASASRPTLRVDDPGSLPSFALSPDGRYAATSGSRGVQVIDTAHLNGEAAFTANVPDVSSIAFAPAGDLLAVGSSSGEVDAFHLPDGALVARESGNDATVMSVVWSGSSTRDGTLFAGGLDSQIVAYDVQSRSRQLRWSGPQQVGTDYLRPVGPDVLGIQPDEGQVPESRINLWVADGTTGRTSRMPLRMPNGTYIASLSADAADRRVLLTAQEQSGPIICTLFDRASGRVLGRFRPATAANTHWTYEGIISPDGRTALVSIGPREVATYALPSGRLLVKRPVTFVGPARDHTYAIPVAFAPDGRVLIYGSAPPLSDRTASSAAGVGPPPARPHQQLTLLDLRTGRASPPALLGAADIYPVAAWSPDGRRLAVGTDDGVLTILDARTMRPVAQQVRTGAGGADTIDYSPDGSMIVTAGWDGKLHFIDAATGRTIGPPIRVAAGRAYAWFDRGGNVLGYALNGDDTQQRRFTYPGHPGAWLAAACATAGSDLTPSEWATYVPDRPYSRTCR